MIRPLVIHLLLVAGFALTTYGLLEWSHIGFALTGLFPCHAGHGLHPLYPLALGMAMIPPAFRELYLHESKRNR